MRHWLLALALVLVSSTSRAEVADSAAGGFTVKHVITVDVPAAKAWATLLDIRSWWDKGHTWSGDAANLTLEARAGGCFCEKLPNGGGVRHMTTVYVEPRKLLRLTGGLGPLQDMAVSGVLTLKFIEVEGKTTLDMTYKVGGYDPAGLANLARPVDAVLGGQLQRWKRKLETGKP